MRLLHAISDMFWFVIICAFINSETKYREFRATRKLKRGEITNSQAYKIIYGSTQ